MIFGNPASKIPTTIDEVELANTLLVRAASMDIGFVIFAAISTSLIEPIFVSIEHFLIWAAVIVLTTIILDRLAFLGIENRRRIWRAYHARFWAAYLIGAGLTFVPLAILSHPTIGYMPMGSTISWPISAGFGARAIAAMFVASCRSFARRSTKAGSAEPN